MSEQRIQLPHGFLTYRVAPGATCEIVDIEVETGHRREGVGRKLVEALMREISDGRADRVYAITRADNEIAQQFYEGLLFRACPLRRFYSGERGIDAVLYVRGRDGPV